MNRKGVREIKRRIEEELNNFNRIYGCYVNAAHEIISEIDISVVTMDREERQMYSKIFRKLLSGRFGRNLMNIEFATEQVENSDEHKLLQALRQNHVESEDMRKLLYDRIIESVNIEDNGYVILLAADSYDVPYKAGNDEYFGEASNEQFDYILCAVCPVKDSKAALQYKPGESAFRGISTGSVLSSPMMGFMFPCFDDRAANIYDALYYTGSATDVHEDFIKCIFNTEKTPMAAEVQKNCFGTTLSDALGDECSLNVVRNIQSNVMEVLEAHKLSKEPDAPEMYIDDIQNILIKSGISDDKAIAFKESCRKNFDDTGSLDPNNLIDINKFVVSTPELSISIEPEIANQIKAKTIDGRRYLLVPVGGSVTINGIDAVIPEE